MCNGAGAGAALLPRLSAELEGRLTGIEPEKIPRRKPAQESDAEGDVGLRIRIEPNEFFFADRYCEIVRLKTFHGQPVEDGADRQDNRAVRQTLWPFIVPTAATRDEGLGLPSLR